jgi:anti-sigma B factor antagonist
MKTDVRTYNDIRIIDWSGEITLGDGTVSLRQNIRDIVKYGGKKILLNLGAVHYIDCSGVGELISTYKTVTSNGGQFKILNLTHRIRELLAITKLLKVFEVFDNEKDALESFD